MLAVSLFLNKLVKTFHFHNLANDYLFCVPVTFMHNIIVIYVWLAFVVTILLTLLSKKKNYLSRIRSRTVWSKACVAETGHTAKG
jgi:hypothetical protein